MLRSILLVIDSTCAYRVMCRVAQLARHHDDLRLTVAAPSTDLLEQARAIGAQLVVVGAAGYRGLRLAGLLGKTPVLLARVPDTEAYRRPLVAIDARGHPLERFDFSRALLSPRAPLMNAVHVHTRFAEHAKSLVSNAIASLGALGLGWTRHLRYGDPRTAIASVAGEMRADLVIVGSRPRPTWARILFGSITRDVVARTSCDVLAVPVLLP